MPLFRETAIARSCTAAETAQEKIEHSHQVVARRTKAEGARDQIRDLQENHEVN